MTRRRHAAAALLLATALACGRKAAPVAPELVRPEAPGELAASSTPEGVQVSWLRPQRYSGGQRMNDLAGFVIERAPGEGGNFTRVGTLELTDQTRFRKERRLTWLDRSAVQGTRYRYRVIARTLDGYQSTAGPVTVQLGNPPAEPAPSPGGP